MRTKRWYNLCPAAKLSMMDAEEESEVTSKDAAMFSFPQFRFVTNEITERLKVCSSASCFMEDLAEIENSLGKSLAKVLVSITADIDVLQLNPYG